MKRILGLDLGANSIGWAVIDNEEKKIINAGSRIIPMDAAALGDFEKGTLQSQASVRTGYRSTRRLYQRATLRRERLLRVLNILGFLPEHFREQIDFTEHPGQFKSHGEPLLPYRLNSLTNKREFIFMDSFNEMLDDFKTHQPQLVADNKKVPYDWTIYYLRKKALSQPISKEELAWIILNFNTKRGYYQLRGEEDILTTQKNEEYKVLKVISVDETGEDKKRPGYKWYDVTYENGAIQHKASPIPPRKPGDIVELIVSTELDKDGNVRLTKDGKPKISLRDPKEDDWTLMKKRTESILNNRQGTVGSYIYDAILQNPKVKVRGKLIHTIERNYYRDELRQILSAQSKFIPELKDNSLYMQCVNDLYPQNETKRNMLAKKGMSDLIIDDIIFYQRPLKSKKSEIADCPFEYDVFQDPQTHEWKHQYKKCMPKSNPYFQEFRLWQFIKNLHIFERQREENGRLLTDVDVTNSILKTEEDITDLFDWLNQRKDVNEDQLLKAPVIGLGKRYTNYRWNYVETKSYPCNETHYEISHSMSNVKGKPKLAFSQEMDLWHILYSVEDLTELNKALTHFAQKNGIDEDSFVDAFIHFKPFEKDYGAYSEKAVKKLLALMRCGKYWDENSIDSKTHIRIEHIITGEEDNSISTRVREKCATFQNIRQFQGLTLSLACYVVYNRHSEVDDMSVWESPDDINKYLREFHRKGLKNPVVESVLSEALRLTRDIWIQYGKIDEVHIEMARDLKQNNEQRKKATDSMLKNQSTNLRIRLLLQEFASNEYKVENVRPHSPSQQELLKIYEEYALNNNNEIPDDIKLIIDNLGNPSKHVSSNEIMRYRLWLEQRYLSPYTGQPIPLSKLFTTDYQIEHVIPRARYYDDSLSNKVICESEVNKDKDRMLGYEYILKNGGKIITGSGGQLFKILDHVQYEDFVKKHYANNRGKMKKLLMEDIPDSFIQRQLNDSRYIARKALEIFSHLVREQGEDAAVSKHVIATNGNITDRLKKDWGINDVWNDIVAPRFERMNRITGTQDYGGWVNRDGKRFFQTNVPLNIAKGFNKKRIDHRHHAMDALVIACATRDHVNLLNNQAALSGETNRFDLQHKLCEKVWTDDRDNYSWRFVKPWESFTADVKDCLSNIIVSFKNNIRIITKTSNHYWHYENGVKVLAKQRGGNDWAIRQPLHKETVSGSIRLQKKYSVKLADALENINYICDKQIRHSIKEVLKLYHGKADLKTLVKYFKDRNYIIEGKNIKKVDVWKLTPEGALSATRVTLTDKFTRKDINAITDTGIQKILLRHLDNYKEGDKDHPELAFSPEGISYMNSHLRELNNGKDHQPILKVRKYERLGEKFNVGTLGNKDKKFVEAAKGTNLFFAVYKNSEGKRSYSTIPLNVVVEQMKNGLGAAPNVNAEGDKLLFTLSPGDLVYMPEEGEHISVDKLDRNKIYKFVSTSQGRACFIPYNVAIPIYDGHEYGSHNKIELDDDKRSIKGYCIKLKVDRIGNVTL